MTRSHSSAALKNWRLLGVALWLLFPLVACSESGPTGGPRLAHLQLEAAFSAASLQFSRAVRYDSVQAVATDPRGSVVGSKTVPVPAEASLVTLDLEVQLTTSVELITVTIRLFSTNLLALEGSSTFSVDTKDGVTTAPAITLFPVAPLLEINPGTVDIVSRGPNPPPTDLLVANPGGAMLSWSAATDASWLSLSVPSGSTPSGGSTPLSLTVDATGLSEGVHSATLTMDAAGAVGAPASVPVTLTVTHTPSIGVSAGSLTFSTPEQSSPTAQILATTNDGGGRLDWSAQVDQSWLSLSAASGSLAGGETASLTASVSSTRLPPGTYSASIQLSDASASNSPVTVAVALTVSALPRWDLQVSGTGSGSGTVTSSPTGINCTISSGAASGACTTAFVEGNVVSLTATGATGETLGAWGGACSGSGACQVTLSGPASVTAGFVPAPPTVGASPSSLTFTLQQWSGSGQQPLTVTNVGGGVVNFTAFGDQQWIAVVPSTGSLGAGQSMQLDVIVSSDTTQGTYNGKVLVANVADTTNTVSVPVTLNVIPCTSSCGGGPAPDSATATPPRRPVGYTRDPL